MEKKKGKFVILSNSQTRSNEGNGSSFDEDCFYKESLKSGTNVDTSNNESIGVCTRTTNTRVTTLDCGLDNVASVRDPIKSMHWSTNNKSKSKQC